MNEMSLDNSHDIFLDGDHICRIGNIAKKVRQAVLCLLKTEYNTEISIYLIYMAFAMNYCDDVKV